MKNSNFPLVSVVIPTYNHANFLKKALSSVRSQTYINWELIIIDNHSIDNTDEVIFSFCDKRIQLIKIHNQGSIAKSRNLGIKVAKGDWIAFLDSDDLWFEQKLEISILQILKNPLIDSCSTNELRVDTINQSIKPLVYGPFCKDFYRTLLLYGNRLSPSATIVKKEFLLKNQILFRENIEFITAEDYDFWLQMAEKNAFFHFIQSAQGEYNIHQGNESGRLDLHLNSVKNVLKNHVFERQNFEKDKVNLWSLIECRLLISDSIRFFGSKKYLLATTTLVRALTKAPAFSIAYSLKKLSRKKLCRLIKIKALVKT